MLLYSNYRAKTLYATSFRELSRNRRDIMSSEPISKFNGWFVLLFLLLGIGIVAGIAYILVSPQDSQFKLNYTAEAQTGVLLVGAVCVMLLLLFTVTAGFRALGLSAKDQPLGLPPGSVRAFIALILIMIFVILTVYAVRVVGEGTIRYVGLMNATQINEFQTNGDVRLRVTVLGGELYDVWQVIPINEAGDRLAQQLVTTVATLVVAVAGFYFGATNVHAALEQHDKASTASTAPLIRNITPDNGNRGAEVAATLTGRNMSATKFVRLVREKETIEATDILFNETTIQCKFRLPVPAQFSGDWDVVVENVDGAVDRLEGAFTINT